MTNIFNKSMLQDLSCVESMDVSSIPSDMLGGLKKSVSEKKQKFYNFKQSSSYRLRINQPVNKYWSRKKEEIRLFLLLD